jgi:serine/threonine-protein kinase
VPWNDPGLAAVIIEDFKAVADAVAYLQQSGIVHRDIKPSDVLIFEDSRLRLSDFGLVKTLEGEPESVERGALTSTGAELGTPQYLAPEQEPGGKIAPPADVYALGVMLPELVTGGHAKPRTHIDVGSTLANIPALTSLPRALRELILRCTSARSEHRLPDAQAVLDTFTTIVEDRSRT